MKSSRPDHAVGRFAIIFVGDVDISANDRGGRRMSSIGQSQDTTPATPVSEKRRQPMVAAQRAEQGLVSGALPNDAETGTTDDNDLSSWHDDRSRKIDRLSHEWACHKGTLSDNDAPREKGALHDKRPLHDK